MKPKSKGEVQPLNPPPPPPPKPKGLGSSSCSPLQRAIERCAEADASDAPYTLGDKVFVWLDGMPVEAIAKFVEQELNEMGFSIVENSVNTRV